MNTGLGLGGGQQLGGGLNLGGGGLKLGQGSGLQLGLGQQQTAYTSATGQQTTGLGLGMSGGLGGGGGLQLGGGGGGLQLGGGGGGLRLGAGMQAKTTGTTGTGLGVGTGFGTGLGTQQQGGLNLGGGGLGTSGVGIGLNFGGISSQQQTSKPGLTLGTGLGLSGTSGLGTTSGLHISGTGMQQGIFSGQQQQQQQQQQMSSVTQMANALVMPLVFGDSRDLTIKKFNQLQAYCGHGKGIVNNAQSIDFNQENPYCRFKAVCYSCLPRYKDEDGLVALYVSKPDKELSQTKDSLLTLLQSVIANSNVTVVIEGIRPLPDNSTELTIYATEKSIVGGSHRLSARNLFVYLQANQTKLKPLGVTNLLPKTGFSEQLLTNYLETPPAGINPQVWEQAKKDNPDPKRLVPVPVVGFTALQQRMKQQEQETLQHAKRLEIMNTEIEQLQNAHTHTQARLADYKRKLTNLAHRLLKVMIVQEICRKSGCSIQVHEEELRIRLEKIQTELNAPTQLKGRLSELVSQIRLQRQLTGSRADARYQTDPLMMEEVKQHLLQQQAGISHLVTIVKEGLADVTCISEGLSKT